MSTAPGPAALRALTVPPGPDVLDVLLPALAEALAGGPALLPLPPGPPAVRERLLAALRPDLPAETEGLALVVPTSGSTGEPKGALLGAAAVRASAAATHERLGGPGRWLLALPPTHVAGLMVLARSLAAGTVPVALDRSDGFDPTRFAALASAAGVGRAGPWYTALVPTQLGRLLASGVDLAGFDAVLLGGGAPPAGLVSRARERGVAVVETYGMSETCGGCVYDGRPLAGVEADLATDGRVRLRGATLFQGYRRSPALTAEALDPEGWLRTGDLGRFGPDGRLSVLGRADDVVVTGGTNVALTRVEAVLGGHPQVRACAVVGVPDPEWGHRLVAVVEPEGQPPTLTELQGFAAQALEPAELPRALEVVRALPLLASGKPDRLRVRTLVGAPPT